MGTFYFPFDALDPERNEERSRRALALRTPTRSEVGPLSPDEWFCRLYFFAPEEHNDLVVSVCGTCGVVATEVRRPPDAPDKEPRRETHRLNELEASVFRDRILRIEPWNVEAGPDSGDASCFALEFIEHGRYVCLAFGRLAASSPIYELAGSFCDLWKEHTSACRACLGG